jgi:predicted GNAT family acetyltransferase
MSVRVTSDPAEFAATVFPFLEKDPVLNTVLLSNVQDRATGLLTEEWSSRFGREYEQTRGSRLHKLELGRLWLWESAGQPVCLVGHQATVFGSTRVGPVYTPSEHRGHGYASALTAFVSRRIIDSGSAACLYTDLANRTSNKIYAAIGYEPVADFVRYDFS